MKQWICQLIVISVSWWGRKLYNNFFRSWKRDGIGELLIKCWITYGVIHLAYLWFYSFRTNRSMQQILKYELIPFQSFVKEAAPTRSAVNNEKCLPLGISRQMSELPSDCVYPRIPIAYVILVRPFEAYTTCQRIDVLTRYVLLAH